MSTTGAPTVTVLPDGNTRSVWHTEQPGRTTEHSEIRDPQGQLVETGDRTIDAGLDGNQHITSNRQSTDPDSGDVHNESSSEIRYGVDSPDGSHHAGDTDSRYHQTDTDPNGDVTTTDGVTGTDAAGNRSTTESSTDSTGLTTVVTTTVNPAGEGTRHTTVVDQDGNTVVDDQGNPLDEIEDVDLPPQPDDDTDLFPQVPDPQPTTSRSTDSTTDPGRGQSTGDTTGRTDTGRTDTGRTDTGRTETGTTDAGRTDAGTTDAGTTETETTDAGVEGTAGERGTGEQGATSTPGQPGSGPIDQGTDSPIRHDPFFGLPIKQTQDGDHH